MTTAITSAFRACRAKRRRAMQLKDSSLFRQQAYLDGVWCDADNGSTLPVSNPASGALLGHVPAMGREETRRAIVAAERAQLAWREQTGKARWQLLRRW